jgi:hypothetical protein
MKESEMRKSFMVLAAALIALPIFAQQSQTPTVTPAANRAKDRSRVLQQQGRVVQPTVTPTPGNTREVALGGPDTATRQQRGLTPTPGGTEAEARGKPTKDQRGHEATHVVQQMTGKVIRLSGSTFAVLSGGKEVTLSAAKLKALPKVGQILDVTYTQTPGGPLEATTVTTSKSNSY